METALKYI